MSHERLIVKAHRGKFSLSPKKLQEFESTDSPFIAAWEEPKSITGKSITKLSDGFIPGTSGTFHRYLGKKVGKLVNPSFDNQSDLFSSFDREPNTQIMLQVPVLDIGDVDGDEPDW